MMLGFLALSFRPKDSGRTKGCRELFNRFFGVLRLGADGFNRPSDHSRS